MAACSCLFRNPLAWLPALGSFLAYAHSSEFRPLIIFFTFSAAILYRVIISCSKSCQQKLTHQEDPTSHQDEDASDADKKSCSVQQDSCHNVGADVSEIEHEEASKGDEMSEKKEDRKEREVLLTSSEALSDSESFEHTTSSEDLENDWISRENLSQSTQFSDGSISDEESLIEITLPEGHYVESKRQEYQKQPCSYGFQQKWPDCSMDSHFRQVNWMEMLMEEENLIEIDIGMGSIKYSRFEIEA